MIYLASLSHFLHSRFCFFFCFCLSKHACHFVSRFTPLFVLLLAGHYNSSSFSSFFPSFFAHITHQTLGDALPFTAAAKFLIFFLPVLVCINNGSKCSSRLVKTHTHTQAHLGIRLWVNTQKEAKNDIFAVYRCARTLGGFELYNIYKLF